MEVCPLAREIMLLRLNLYPPRYRAAFAFSILLCPPFYRLVSRLAFPGGERRVYHVPCAYQEWGRSRLFAGGASSAGADFEAALPVHLPFWLKPLSTFGLSILTTFSSDSHLLTVPFDPSSRPPWCWQSQPLLTSRLSSLRMRLHCFKGFAPHRYQ
jgi:hypothetical protein